MALAPKASLLWAILGKDCTSEADMNGLLKGYSTALADHFGGDDAGHFTASRSLPERQRAQAGAGSAFAGAQGSGAAEGAEAYEPEMADLD